MVRFEKVAMRYGSGPEILHQSDLELPTGSFRFLTGPSGAGKSTLLRLMYLADRPTQGHIWLFGRDVTSIKRRDLPQIRRRIGVVFQDFRLLDHLSAFDNVALPLRIGKVAEDVVRANVWELMHWVGLSSQLSAKPSTLSGGEQQRIAIARAVITQPQLLIADEPTGNVDEAIAIRLISLFEELNRLGTTVIIATHNENLVEQFGYPVLHIEGGRLQEHPGSRVLGSAPTSRQGEAPDSAYERRGAAPFDDDVPDPHESAVAAGVPPSGTYPAGFHTRIISDQGWQDQEPTRMNSHPRRNPDA